MGNRSVFIGNYNDLEIYYNKEKKILETSENKKSSFNQSKLVGLILVTTPFFSMINSIIDNIEIEARIILWIISILIGIFSGYIVAIKIHEKIKLSPITMNKNQFEEFYLENEKRLKILKWVMVCIILPLFIETYIFLRLGIFMAGLIFLLNTFVVALLFFGGVHCQQQIFKEIKQSYIIK